ncbi:MAG: hypothetical protein V1865_01770 [bacterium]
MKYKIAQLIVNPEQADSISQIFISQPGLEEEALLGRLFVMVESQNRKADVSKLINFIANQIEHNYYQNEKAMLVERLASIKIEDIFESAIAKLNQNIISFLQAEKIKFVISDISLTVGVLHKNKIHFTNIGRNKALLIYQPKVQALNQDIEYDLTDITKKTNDPTQEVFNINKLFNNVVSGSIPAGGCFIFTNEALSEYLSEQQLIKVLTTLHPSGAVEQIKNILSKTNIHVPFLALVIKSTKLNQFEPQQKTAPVKLKRDRESELLPNKERVIPKNDQTKTINTLNDTEEQTANILNPIGLINLKRVKNLFKIKSFKKIKPNTALLKNNIIGKRATKFNMENVGKFLTIVKKLAIILFNFIFILIRAILRKNNWIKAKDKTINIAHNLKQMNRKRKIILLVVAGCALILVANLIILNIIKQNQADQEAYLALVKNIEQKQLQIESGLLYGNRDNARNILNVVKSLLTEFPQKSNEQQEKFVELNNKYQKQLDIISNITRIDNPEELKVFTSESSLTSLALLGGSLYITDNTTKTIHSLNLSDKSISSNSYAGLENIINLGEPHVDNNIIYYYTENQIISYDPSGNKLETITINMPPQKSKTMSVYNNRFYIFDYAINQLYRYSRYGNKLENRMDWLKFENKFSDVKSISIEGYVYMLDNDTVLKYGGGRRQEFTLDIIEPRLSNPSKLIVPASLNLIYVLEPSKNRLVVYDKEGLFITQYSSDKFTNLIDFAIDETNKKVYLLNGQTIYQIDVYKK